jgi:hypothetical protein
MLANAVECAARGRVHNSVGGRRKRVKIERVVSVVHTAQVSRKAGWDCLFNVVEALTSLELALLLKARVATANRCSLAFKMIDPARAAPDSPRWKRLNRTQMCKRADVVQSH